MDDAKLKSLVEEVIRGHFTKRQPFTTAHISNPIILANSDVRHRQVRFIIEQMWSAGEMEDAGFACSTITVEIDGSDIPVRAWHPDEPDFDLDGWDAQLPKLDRSKATVVVADGMSGAVRLAPTRGFSMADADDDDGTDDNVPQVANIPPGVTKKCFVQPKQGSLNIPRILVKQAGLNIGDSLRITVSGQAVKIERSIDGNQKVDAEGRIRLHGKNVEGMGKTSGVPCVAMVVKPPAGDDQYIQVQ